MKLTTLCSVPVVAMFLSQQIGASPSATQKQTDLGLAKSVGQLNNRGLDHFKNKQYEEAIRLFRRALDIQPDSPDVLNNLGRALDAVGKDSEAIDDFDK